MRIIDVHTHLWPGELAAKAVPALIENAGGRLTAYYDGTAEGLVAEMDRTGVGVSVIQPVSTRPSQVVGINDWVASLASDRIVPFGSMHPEFENPATEIARMAALGLRGFKMHPEHQSFEPHDPRLEEIWAAAEQFGLVVLFHAGADLIHSTVRGTAESFVRLIDAWPDLRVILAHLGGFRQWKQVAELLSGREVWLDTAYTLGYLADDEFAALVRSHGPERVLFGSDGPWTDAAYEIERLRGLGFSAGEVDGIIGGNAARLLRL